ncbi:MAG: polyphosphate kinase 1 [Phycisphaerae bacterium]|nr:polyphosphate kinase 1 [Phycisphaerae bacterium]MBM90055.1 polyphosphate kinase 1 [Phycisphaerae bacterium]
MKSDMPDPEQARFMNRDISWLEFNRRVLAQAFDDSTPLLERVKFIAIFASNLDEFFMKRIGLLKSRHRQHIPHSPNRPDELPPMQTLHACYELIREMETELSTNITDRLMPDLAAQGIEIIDYEQLGKKSRKAVDEWFNTAVFPILTPLAVDPGHRFPFISNLSTNLGLLVEPKEPGTMSDEPRFARIKVPAVLPYFIRVDHLRTGDEEPNEPTLDAPARFVPLDQIIINNLDDLFPGMRVTEVLPFRLTRSAAVELDDEDVEDLLEHVEEELRMRRFANSVRIQTPPNPSPRILNFLLNELRLSQEDHFARPGPIACVDLFEIANIDRPDLQTPPWKPVRPPALADPEADIFAKIRERDILVHHPYESFSDSVERFISSAASDPDVLAIKLTLYRTSQDSPFVDSLVRAAEDGKQVACLVELRARFDEEKNVTFARQLEAAGVHVAYGVLGLKTHSKCSLVVRREKIDGNWGLRSYAHLGTGNYHPKTAQLYTDLGLLTADEAITGDVVRLFNMITGLSSGQHYDRLVVAPDHMRNRFIELINTEIANAKKGRPAHIFAKMNSMEDRMITEKLYEASQAGVQIDLIVRGFCCLRPGIPGVSENIRVRSIIGRFLEHSRVYAFADGQEDPSAFRYYISSADWMYRNLSNRVEAACPIEDPDAKRRIWELLDTVLRDQRKSWIMQPNGRYLRLTPPSDAPEDSPERMGTFATLMRRASGNRPSI